MLVLFYILAQVHEFVLLICGDNSYAQSMCKVVIILSVVCGVGPTGADINVTLRSELVNSTTPMLFTWKMY